MEEKQIVEFSIYDPTAHKTIFSDSSISYVIPLYQRAFAWEDREILQLIDDINDFDNTDGSSYYLGSIIVSKEGNRYEVIDGQQRLTALFLLLNYLQLPMESILTFECRKKSDYTLQMIVTGKDAISIDDIDDGLMNGRKIIENELGNYTDDEKTAFINKLPSVKVYRIEVPENTDLNHYFEIMNTRGEQLEQQDILKAQLMSYLDGPDMATFATIWDACSDMTGYVQMHFDTGLRAAIFGWEWEDEPYDIVKVEDNNTSGKEIREIIDPKFIPRNEPVISDSEERVRFESIITFPYFLLHVLKIYVWSNQIDAQINELLDDKKLTDTFSSVIEEGKQNGEPIEPAAFANGFIKCLLKCRFLFDRYIVKREFINDDSDGAWSIKTFHSSGQQTKKKPYYSNSYFGTKGEWAKNYEPRHKRILMLQSCLRVSYTSPKIMHWITELLKWLYDDTNRNDMAKFEGAVEDYIRFGSSSNTSGSVTVKDYLTAGNYDMGVNTPHLIFNYLDYLLWKNNQSKYQNFVFEFRNSVEHWYPQHPSEGTFGQWAPDAGVNNFGNLCIIQRNVNSKFSNMSPESKQSTFEDMISKGSLKLRVMADLVKELLAQGINPNKEWKEKTYIEHGNQMIRILKDACNMA